MTVESSLKRQYNTKLSSELYEIANSPKYQSDARSAATKLLEERDETELLKKLKPEYSKYDLIDLLNILKDYRLNFSTSSDTLKIYRDNKTGLTGMSLIGIGVLLAFMCIIYFSLGNQSAGIRWMYISIVALVAGYIRMGFYDFKYFILNSNSITIKRGLNRRKFTSQYSPFDFESLSVNQSGKNTCVMLNLRNSQPEVAVELRTKNYGATSEYANALCIRLTEWLKNAR
ncbi:hypothetical protein BFP72_03215 [Reichenbachiella sp. 5M10]|uniref:hypothetical protein n=1 Tax=Reichenbachiella sp. 5M10 TaxID=1889772 RepID=UPI000C15C6FE|nr:hypothetical protein [Reichenbachiella sp. 5M10]PIB34491.1 hypothetical protein BFP72_03215 [Reichenbachiella sp. 5M10]